MKARIELTFAFREPTLSELEMDKRNNWPTLPRFRHQEDINFLLWQDSDLVLWLRELAAHLPNNTPVYGPYLIDAHPTPTDSAHESDFIRRLSIVRLKKLFFGDVPAPWLELDRITVAKDRKCVVCRYES